MGIIFKYGKGAKLYNTDKSEYLLNEDRSLGDIANDIVVQMNLIDGEVILESIKFCVRREV